MASKPKSKSKPQPNGKYQKADVKPNRKQPKEADAKAKAEATADVNAPINFDEGVSEGKQIVATMRQSDAGQIRLGEIAEKLEPKYHDRTLARYAESIGIEPATLKRYRTVWRQWVKIGASAPQFYSAASALAKHPDAAAIARGNPTITGTEARALMRDYKRKQAEEDDQEKGDPDWRRKKNEEWQRALAAWANKGFELASLEGQKLDLMQRRILRDVLEPELIPSLEKLIRFLIGLVAGDDVKQGWDDEPEKQTTAATLSPRRSRKPTLPAEHA